jgi:hypothetical protein
MATYFAITISNYSNSIAKNLHNKFCGIRLKNNKLTVDGVVNGTKLNPSNILHSGNNLMLGCGINHPESDTMYIYFSIHYTNYNGTKSSSLNKIFRAGCSIGLNTQLKEVDFITYNKIETYLKEQSLW